MKEPDTEKDHQVYCQLLELWAKENPIKTNKLQMLLLVNALFLIGVSFNGGFTKTNWPLYLAGAMMSGIWILSIGRTALFQKVWQRKIAALAERYPEDPRFHVLDSDEVIKTAPALLRVLGGVSSKSYLLGAPILFCVIWLVLLLVSIL
ncbi:hypothetical protein GWO43_07800 [candidate division KSB1 bacterium]|nr:hypothetical protein [candidate division KSB1 bacterium]NIR73161.1 hypothetical protein [candidate division KSB1 bacterium]NIS23868.1 hypothetical protein [candidate division KSB1 bacterium]NIT70789.1 hypothetical protein [candidate division KSB1 bacterium]NIU24517.1 hypothetical protein [candidate division KSB1 bacterium]